MEENEAEAFKVLAKYVDAYGPHDAILLLAEVIEETYTPKVTAEFAEYWRHCRCHAKLESVASDCIDF